MPNIKVEYFEGTDDFEFIEYFNEKGELHNENGPAFTEFFVDQNKSTHRSREQYYLNGKLHNNKGPAQIGWFPDGELWYEEFWLNGKELTKEEWLKECQT